MPTPFLAAVSALRAAGEPTRLRVMALLARAELTVGEVCAVLDQSQPRVSRHLKLLCDAGLLDRVREQHWVYYRVPSSGLAREVVQQFLALVAADDEVLRRDRKRMEHVITERARLASHVLPDANRSPSEVIDAIVLRELSGHPVGALLDVGTGSGHLLELLGAQATRAVGVDISTDALRLARTNVHGAGLSHCELQRCDMYDLPFNARQFDTVTVDRVLARAARPVAALKEIARCLAANGRLILIEDFDALSELSAANPIATLREWFTKAGLACTRIQPADGETGHLLVTLATRVEHTSAAA